MLEKQEQEYGLDYINYCVAKKMFKELVAFAFADDDAKRGLIKTYLNDIPYENQYPRYHYHKPHFYRH